MCERKKASLRVECVCVCVCERERERMRHLAELVAGDVCEDLIIDQRLSKIGQDSLLLHRKQLRETVREEEREDESE